MPPDKAGNMAYPFFYMQSEGFWELVPLPGCEEAIRQQISSMSRMRQVAAGARIDEELFLLMQDPEARKKLRLALIQTYFTPEIQTKLLEKGQINQEAYAYSQELLQAKNVAAEETKPLVRDQGFRKAIISLYDHRCAICGVRMLTPEGHTIVEAAHITLAIGLTIIEMSEEVEVRYVNGKYIRESDYVPPKRGENRYTWTTKKDYPTGRLCLQAYSPYWRAKWIKQWRETKKRDLENQIKSIVKEIEQAAGPVARLVEEGERQAEIERQRWEAQQERWRREEAERKAAKALKESREELFQIIDAWAEANRIEEFFHDIEKRAVSLSENERFRISERLKLARKLIGSVDALDYFINWRSPAER